MSPSRDTEDESPGKANAVQPKARILDVYGACARDVGGWLAIADLIDLLARLDVDAQAIRSAASRLKRQHLLVSQKIGGVAGYALSDAAAAILEDGDRRIFRKLDADVDPSWLIVTFSVPEAKRQQRYLIRSRLTQLGFGQGPASVLLAPAVILPETERLLGREGLLGNVALWKGEYHGFDDFEAVVASAWDLPAIAQSYEAYLREMEPVAERWSNGDLTDEQGFVDYMANLAAWRRLPYLDPGLPCSVTPDDWPGERARALFLDVDQMLRPRAMRCFVEVAAPATR